MVVPTLYGFDLAINPVANKGLESRLFSNGTYEAGTLHIIKHCLREGDVFIDIGSNIGLMSILASLSVSTTGRVYAFEPEAETFSILEHNIALNRISNIQAHHLAIGANEGMATIYGSDLNRGSASLIKSPDSHTHGESIPIQTLDTFVSKNNLTHIRMLKIDVEGWELDVLSGAKRLLAYPTAPIVCVEYSNLHPIHNGLLIDIYHFLVKINHYKIYKLKSSKENKSTLTEIKCPQELPSHDNLFCFLPDHLSKLDDKLFI